MKKRLLFALSLILAALLLVVACDDAPKTPNESVNVPGDLDNNKPGSEDSTNEPESTPSEEIIEITEEPDNEDLTIISTLFNEAKGFIETEQAQKIAFDLLTAVGEKGIELNGENYSMAVFGNINEMTLTASVIFNNASFAELTLDGSLTLTIGPNEENETREVGNSEDPQLPFKITTEGDGITLSINDDNMVIKSVEDLISEDFETFISNNLDKKALLDVVNAFIPNLIESYNETFENYEVSTDLLSIVISEKISGDIAISGSGFTSEEGLILDSKFTANTEEPLVYNDSEYRITAKGNVNIIVNENLNFDPDYIPSEEEVDNSKLYPVTITGKVLFDVEIIKSDAVGENKIQIQVQLSDVEKDNAFYLVINGKVLDLKALIPPEEE